MNTDGATTRQGPTMEDRTTETEPATRTDVAAAPVEATKPTTHRTRSTSLAAEMRDFTTPTAIANVGKWTIGIIEETGPIITGEIIGGQTIGKKVGQVVIGSHCENNGQMKILRHRNIDIFLFLPISLYSYLTMLFFETTMFLMFFKNDYSIPYGLFTVNIC